MEKYDRYWGMLNAIVWIVAIVGLLYILSLPSEYQLEATGFFIITIIVGTHSLARLISWDNMRRLKNDQRKNESPMIRAARKLGYDWP